MSAGYSEKVIADICEWVNQEDSGDTPWIFFLYDVAGAGKSAIAHEVAKRFDGSSVSDRRIVLPTLIRETLPSNVFSTIARGLADLDPKRKASLLRVIGESRELRTTFVPIIDALDESENEESRLGLLSVLGTEAAELPPNLRVLITSRAEKDIHGALLGKKHRSRDWILFPTTRRKCTVSPQWSGSGGTPFSDDSPDNLVHTDGGHNVSTINHRHLYYNRGMAWITTATPPAANIASGQLAGASTRRPDAAPSPAPLYESPSSSDSEDDDLAPTTSETPHPKECGHTDANGRPVERLMWIIQRTGSTTTQCGSSNISREAL
ncbi:hypothetical protein JB92DRAFT_3136842 [Gautieria morchelliformis]|nr:hypothetical protein JB92DRAFT_3136842 [Gautieria morchelliformis]